MSRPEVCYEAEITTRKLPEASGGLKTYEALFYRYASSGFGRHHSNQAPRYSQSYGYDRSTMLDDLGEDVHPVKHMWHTEQNILRPFLRAQNLSRDRDFEYITPGQIMALRSGTLLHDIGECEDPRVIEALGFSVADKSYETKTTQDADNEVVVRRFLYNQLYSDFDEKLMEQAESVIAGSSVEFVDTAFNTVERIGYFQTAMRAGAIVLRSLESDSRSKTDRLVKLGKLALRVSDNHRGGVARKKYNFPICQHGFGSK